MNLLGPNALLVDDGYALSELQRVFLEFASRNDLRRRE